MKTFTRAFTLIAVILLLAATSAEAKGRGGSNGAGNGGAAGSTFQKGAGGPQGQQAGGRGAGTASQDRSHQRLHVPDPQRGQYQDCTAAGDRMRQQGRELSKAAGGSGWSAAEARRQQDQVRQHAEAAFRQHDRLMGGLGASARGALQDRTRTLDRDRDRIQTHLRALDGQLASPNPDQGNLRAEARKLNQAMKAWQKHYRQLGNDLGATAG